MNVESLRALATEYVRDHADALDLDRDALLVEYVLNWGGFVNYSYRIRDGRTAYHLKLSMSVEDRTSLQRWMKVGSLLEPYHAPPILEWVDLGTAAGLLFPFIPGNPPALNDDVLAELVPTLARLNADEAVAAALAPAGRVTARDVYLSSFHDRFLEDLRGIREERPPFVSRDLVEWLGREVESLAQAIAATPAFAEPLKSPVHGDLWLNNVLWVSGHAWHLIDWDDLRIGDPAADLAALLGPSPDDVRPLRMLDRVNGSLPAPQRQRLPLLGRATLLDWIIDPLSDWMDAGAAAAYEREVKTEKERVHCQALAHYRHLYG
jgi:hypothetical protein